MNNIYVHEGTEYEVAPHRLQDFLSQFPGAIKMEEPEKTVDPVSDTDSGLESGSSELPKIKKVNITNPLSVSPKFNHIKKFDFFNLSKEGFFGREEKIVPKLKELYEKDNQGKNSNIKFEETGAGNSVKITLPGNDYGEVFDLPHTDDVFEVQKAYIDITEYIESKKRKQIGVKDSTGGNHVKKQIEEVFTSRELKVKEASTGVKYSEYDVADPVFNRDENIATELNLILGDDGYKFEEQKMFRNAIKVTLPNKNSQTFNVGGSNKDAYSQIINFIETDSKGYKQTKKYKDGVEALDTEITSLMSKYVDSDNGGFLLNSDQARSTLKRKIINQIGSSGWQALFFSEKEEFQDLSRDEKGELVDNRIQEIVNNATEGFTRGQTIKAIKTKMEDGMTDGEIETEVEGSVKNSFTGTDEVKKLKQTIFNFGLELDNPEITKERRDEILGSDGKPGLLDQANALREEKEGGEYSYFINPETGERELTKAFESKVFDLTGKIQEKQNKLLDDKLTRPELRKEWLYTNLAHAQTVDDWKSKKRKYPILKGKYGKADIKKFMETYPDIVVKDGMAVVSDAQAGRIGGTLLDFDVQREARLGYLNEITTDKEVYNKMYALNENLFSQKKQTFVQAVGAGLKESVAGVLNIEKTTSSDEFRQAYLGTMQELGIETTAEEEEYAKTTLAENSGRAVGGLPKMVADFWIANKATAALGAVSGVNKLVNGLKAKKYLVNGKRLTQTKLINHINKVNPRFLKGVAAEQQGAKIAQWIVKNKKIAKVVNPSFGEKAMAAGVMANVEGIKMEIAMQDPMGLSGVEAPIGSSYATGVGFGLAGSIIPWNKMWTGLTGNKAGKWKGLYDYTVAAPVNFTVGARIGELSNAIVDDMMGNKTWNNFVEEHYGDFDEIMQHNITDLIMGFSMKLGHFKKFDFAGETKLQAVNRASKIKLDKLLNENGSIKEGKEAEAEKLNTLVNMSEFRLAQMRDTQDYQDPILGPLKLFNDFLPTIEGAKVKGQTKFSYDFNMPRGKNMSYSEIKPGQRLSNGKKNGSTKSIYEFVFNPKNINPGLAPHELSHFGLNRLFTEDVMFKTEFVNGMKGVMEKIKTIGEDAKTGESKEMTLWEAFEGSGLWKKQNRFRQSQVKEEEMFAFLGEYLAKEGNLDVVRRSSGFDRLAGFLENNLKEKLNQTTNLNTEKEIVEFFSNYIETIGVGKSVMPNLKSLEKFVSRTKTENQRKRRTEWEAKNGTGETIEKRSEDLSKRIKAKELELKQHPAKLQLDKDKDTSKYLQNPKIQKIFADLKTMRDNLKNMPKEDLIFGEDPIKKKINDFARANPGGKMMTQKQWNDKGLWDAYRELEGEGGVFDPQLVKGINFPIHGYGKAEWLDAVKFGIEGKKSTEEKKTYVDKGIVGTLERFKPEENESLNGWINFQYQNRRTAVEQYFKANPKAKDIDDPVGKGATIGDRLLADKNYESKVFETEDLSKQWLQEKRGEFKEVVKITGERMLENELPIDSKVFNEKGGWKKTIISKIPEIKNKENASYKNIGDLASNFTFDLVGAKLTPTQKKNSNDFNQPSLKNLQDFVSAKFKQPVMEEGVNERGEREVREKVSKEGEPVYRDINIGETSADMFRDATVKFDKGVSDKIQGTSNFKRLGVLEELYHKATTKDYTVAEMKKMGYDVNPKPDASGAWRVATGPGGNIFIRGKSKGNDITAKDVREFLGQKPDGTWRTLKEDRTLAGKSRRFIDELGGTISSQQVDIAVRANPEIVGEANVARFLLNTSAGRSRKVYSEALENLKTLEQKREFFKGIQTNEFSYLYNNYLSQKKVKNPLGKALRDYFTSLGSESAFDINKVKQTRKEMLTIGKQLEKKLGLEGVVSKEKALKARVAKVLLLQQNLNAIERDLGLKTTDATWLFDPSKKGGIKLAQSLDALLMETFEKKHGKGWYEAIMLLSNTSGTGIGGKRKAIYKTADDARGLANKIKSTKVFKDISRSESNRAGIKKDLMKYVEFLEDGGNINKAKVKEAYKHAETNKKHLKELVEEIKTLRENGEIDHRHVRAFLEVAGGPMTGILRKSASLAIVPKGTGKELFNIFGKEWVLEHTIPTQFVKARIYEYILSGTKQAKEAMDLTLKDFHTTFIPKQLDKMVNKLYLSELPPEYTPGQDPLEWRYYRNAHPSNFNIALENVITGKVYDLNPNFTQSQAQARAKTIKAAHIKLFGEIGLKQAVAKKLNSENLNSASKVDKALAEGRKKNKKSRGMSTWDFDDTLATTKSGVRARIPNPSGKPKPNRKVIFLAGGAGSGKGNVIKKLNLEGQGFKVVNSDISLEWLKKNNGLPENMNDLTKEQRSKLGSLQHQARGIAKRKMMKYKGNADGVVVDGTGGSIKSMEKLVKEFKDKGYDVSMLFVETSLETALARNKARAERSLLDKIVEKNHESVQGNKGGFKEMFGERFMEVKTDNLKQADAMPKELIDKMNDFVNSYEKIRLDAEQFATEGKDILDRGGEFDFAEFNVVTGGEKGPFFQKALDRAKKFGLKDQFVLTARPPEAARPIYEFLKSQGLEIPLENITGLGNSTGEAKALWMLEKFSEGYNNMYFADDAMQNVKAVKNVLEQLDIKSKVQQAAIKYSESFSKDINDIMEYSLGVESKKRFSTAEGKVRGRDKKRRKFFMTDSAADLELLMEPMYGKGKKGVENKKWFEKNFYKPWERGVNDLNTARQTILNDYMSLRKNNKDVVKSLSEQVEGTNFTVDQAARVYIWNKAGFEAPGLTKTSKAKLLEHVANNPKLQAYAESVAKLTKIETGLKQPKDTWYAETLASEVSETGRTVNRDKYIGEWIEIKNEIFSKENMAKMESELGPKWREAVENMFYRMETGTTRNRDLGRVGNEVMNYLNGSVGAIMNLNTRSATLQLISTVNFINHAENNPLRAAQAFANQPQYWKDFMTIMNSDMLKQRRDGLKINVTEAELAAAVDGKGSKAKKAISYILKQGYIPTKIADSFAISSGGATYYRNRAKMYQKQGLSLKEAEAKAFVDFQAIAEKTQQSSRPDLLSQQQTSFEGRLLLPFANTPMQMNRIMMKEALDLSKGRYKGSFGEDSFTNKASKIAYYGAIQSAIFAGLQTGLFALMANSDDEEQIAQKKVRAYNTMADSFLRGMGIPGVVASGIKNAGMKFYEQNQKGFNADYSEVGEALLNMSPTIGSKFSKLDQAGNTYHYNKKEILEKGLSLDNTKGIEAAATTVEALTNVPIARVIRKTENIQGMLDEQNETWQRFLMGLGWSDWDIGGIEYQKKKAEKEEKDKPKKSKRQLSNEAATRYLIELNNPKNK